MPWYKIPNTHNKMWRPSSKRLREVPGPAVVEVTTHDDLPNRADVEVADETAETPHKTAPKDAAES